jgi:hypothetical protein
MKPKLPSPATVISTVALIVALSGTAVAAVNFAQNSGAVDGKSAVASGASLKKAAGKLVATQRSGSGKGRIASKYLDLPALMRGSASTFGKASSVADNGALVPVAIGSVPGIGTLTETCKDENAAAGRLDPATTITLQNTSGEAINLMRVVGNASATVIPLPNGVVHEFTISGSNPFTLHIERRGTNTLVHGVVRQDGRNQPTAQCLVYGFSQVIPPS